MRTTEAFETAYAALNARQREAVDAIDGPVMVVAGPGTGKTNILTLRIANILIKTDTPPEAILALTFTESGASEMRARLTSLIGPDAYRISMTTFHAFCNSIIMEYPDFFHEIAGSSSLTEADQMRIIQRVIAETDTIEILRPVNAPELYLKAIVGALNTLKREGVSPARLSEIAQRDEEGILASDDLYHEKGAYKGAMKGVYQDQLKRISKIRELASIYGAYQAALRSEHAYDYNDMVLEVARALESQESLRLMLQEQYLYLLVDEHQDTNNAQNKVIELLASFWERPNIFVVGDAKQAIYRFQGASIENFHYFKTLYPDVKLIALEDNYRSSQLILDAAHVISPSDTLLRASRGYENTPIQIMPCDSMDFQYWAIAWHVQQRIANGVQPEDIAILGRENADTTAIADVLRRIGVPYSISSQEDALSDTYVRQLMLILDAVRAYGDSGKLFEALHAPVLDVDPLDLYKLINACRGGLNPYDVMRSSARMHECGIDNASRMQTLSSQFTAWARSMSQPQSLEALEAIVRESGILAATVQDVEAPDSLARVHALYDMLKAHVQRNRDMTLAVFVEHLDFIREHRISVHAARSSSVQGKVQIMTVHKSKGLEFSYVYIINAMDSRWGARVRRELLPLPDAVYLRTTPTIPEGATDADERNLFYVALTRARREVLIAYSTHNVDGGDELPARYISEISPHLKSELDIAPLTLRWSQKSSHIFSEPASRAPLAADATFLRDLFERHGLSVTALNNYLTCPWRYFYTNLLRIPEAPSFALMYGNAVDRALQIYFDRLVEGTRGTREDLVMLFEDLIRHQPLQSSELKTALARGRTALEGYYDKYHASWHANIINQLKIPAIELADGTVLNGKIDNVVLASDGTVIVVDYKTGKPKSRAQIMGTVKDGDGNYYRQLVFYKLLLDRWQDGKYRTSQGVIDFIEPDTRGKWHREVFPLTREAVTELEELVLSVANDIRELNFWNKRCDDRACTYCALRDIVEKKTTPR